MKKKYTSGKKGLVDAIMRKAGQEPMSLGLVDSKDTDKPCPNTSAQWLFHYYSKQYNISERDKKYATSRKNRVMDAMITDRVWDQNLADLYDIEQGDVEYHFSFRQYATDFINNELEGEWRTQVFKKGREVFEIEVEKRNKYLKELKGDAKNSKNLLRELLRQYKFEREEVTPRYLVEERLYDGSENITKLHKILQLVEQKHELKELTDEQYQTDRTKAINNIKQYLRRRKDLFNELFNSEESNDNYIYIRAVGVKRIYGTAPIFPPRLNVSSNRHAMDLIDQYVKWYNAKHQAAILAALTTKKKGRDIERYNKKQDVQRKRQQKEETIARAKELQLEGLSLSKIAQQLALEGYKASKSSVQRWLATK